LQDKTDVLRALAEHLNREIHLRPMLESSLALILQLMDLSTGWIYLLDDQKCFTLQAAHGLPPALEANERAALRKKSCRCYHLLLRGKLTGAVNILHCERLNRIYAQLAGASPQEVATQTGNLRVHVTVPLRAGSRILGLLNLARKGPEPLDSDTLALLELAADTLGVAIHRAQMYAQLEARRQEEREASNRLAQTLLGLSDLKAIGEALFSALRPRLNPDALSLFVIDPSESFVELVAEWGWSEEHVGRLQLPIHPPHSNPLARAVHSQKPLLVHHPEPPETSPPSEPMCPIGVKTCLILPMSAAGKVTGAVVAYYLSLRELEEEQIRFASLLTSMAGTAVERTLQYQRNRMLFEQVPVALYRSTPDGRLLDVNSAMVRMLGYPDHKTLLATNATSLYANPEDRARWQRLLEQHGVVTGFEVQWRRFDGTSIWVRESARVIRDAAGRPRCYEGSAEDITTRKRMEENLQYLASHDPLTGVFNRRRFQEELQRFIARAQRTGESGALLFVDLDNFKEVNDRLGHKAGDNLLQAIATAIRAKLRDTDVVGRLGGDEFGILVMPADGAHAAAIARRLLEALRERVIMIEGIPHRVTGSCGIALFPQHGVELEELLAAADMSMYVAKDQGGDRIVVYTPSRIQQQIGWPTKWADCIRRALAEDCFIIYLQPIVDLRKNRITQWECLLRLEEEGEVIPPAHFLPQAERLGLIQEIDVWMFRKAIRLAARRGQKLHVNLSGKTLNDEQTMATLAGELEASPEAFPLLVVEITETVTVVDMAQLVRYLEALRSRGCQIALDDFGIGFASLYYLYHLPVDYLKIDASFVRKLTTDPQVRHIVRAIAGLARGLGRATIAEGVEDQDTLDTVRSLGVDFAQGFYIGRPVPSTSL